MTLDLMTVSLLLAVHWVADFVCQTDKMATNKSTSNKWLTIHVATYSLFFLGLGFKFWAITFVAHWVTDYITSRCTSALYARGDRHNFFVVIGLDQLIHAITLFATFTYLG